MEQDAVWMLGAAGHEISGCCMSASLKDYARFGQFILNDGVAGGQKVLPDGWLASAPTHQAGIEVRGRGYGYQWWTNADGSFAEQGIFGQGIFIDPKRKRARKSTRLHSSHSFASRMPPHASHK